MSKPVLLCTRRPPRPAAATTCLRRCGLGGSSRSLMTPPYPIQWPDGRIEPSAGCPRKYIVPDLGDGARLGPTDSGDDLVGPRGGGPHLRRAALVLHRPVGRYRRAEHDGPQGASDRTPATVDR